MLYGGQFDFASFTACSAFSASFFAIGSKPTKNESILNSESKNTNRLYSDDESFFDLKLRKSLKDNQLTGK
jgi:hypothetical protein